MALLREISDGLLLPTSVLIGIARKASHAYKTYEIPKRQGGSRTIHHPSKELKAVQRWLAQHVVAHWPVHGAAFAYRARRNIKDNASRHADSSYLLRLDLAKFFPSITSDDIRYYLTTARAQPTWSDDDRTLFVELVCRFGSLTIGAPTSPGVSNALCFDLDRALAEIAREHRATYTRYADDLFFSTVQRDVLRVIPERVETVLDNLPCPAGLRVRPEKTRHASKKGRRQVTGLVLGNDGDVHVGRARKRFIRRQIHRWDSLSTLERRSLAGLISFAVSIEPDFLNALILKYGHEQIKTVRDPASFTGGR